ncbi:MAG TPA: M23 family metallopeptidase, partial [Limnochordia bacterium]|nr:M23 family metallopeptidase [Limnochordia bacterium]
VVLLALITLASGWITATYLVPRWVTHWADQAPAAQVVDCSQLSVMVKRELDSLLATEYAWLIDLPKAQQALGTQIDLPIEQMPNPDGLRPSDQDKAAVDAVEAWAVAFDQILWPVKGEVVTGYGWHRHPVYHDWRFNTGLEFVAAGAEQIRSVLTGRVEAIAPVEDGFEVVVNHGGGWQTVYSGIRSVSVKIGDIVDQNQMLAHAGDDGKMFFALLHEGQPVNPMQFMSLY